MSKPIQPLENVIPLSFKRKDEPILSEVIDNDHKGILSFRLSNTNVCFANAIRRTILSDIDNCCILSENNATNQVNIDKNTGRLHNEILKHRLSCIPVHYAGSIDEMQEFCDTYILEIDCNNETDILQFVTTENFKLKNKKSGEMMDFQKTKKIFPPNKISQDYIDFSRLRPKITDSIPGEVLKLSAEFSISNAKVNAMYSVVSKCTYSNTIDARLADEKWSILEREIKARNPGISKEDLKFEQNNFAFLDRARCFTPDSFDFIVQGLGVFSNRDIVRLSLEVLISKFIKMQQEKTPIIPAESTMINSFDIILIDEDYTIGKIIEFIIYQNFYVDEPILTFCGFKKFHPHDTKSTIRIAFKSSNDTHLIQNIINRASQYSIEVIQHIKKSLTE
jgi:DNA-directed RNA polymerase alpha subunit/DNA-directed RNA polymerase subunit L